MSLRAAAGLRRRQYWHIRRNRPAGRTIELTDDVADAIVDEATAPANDTPALSALTLMPYAADCLAELSETQVQIYARIADGEREVDIAKALGLAGRKAVQAERYAAEHTIAMFAQVVHAGRICGKRAVAINEYAAGKASADNVRRAQAHLASCEACAASFRATQSELSRRVAALIPAPTLALVAAHGRDGSGGILARVADLLPGGGGGGRVETVREAALGVFVRNPGSIETMTGAGLSSAGIAAGAKVVIGLCAVAIAGGGAVCSSLGVLPEGLNIRQPAEHQQRYASKPAPKAAPKTATTALVTPVPAPAATVPAPTSRTTPDPAAQAAASARKARAQRKRAQKRQRRAQAAQAAATNPLQSQTATATAATAAPTEPVAPQFEAPAPKPAPKSTGTASPALTGGTNPLLGRTP